MKDGKTNNKLIMIASAVIAYLVVNFAMYTLCELFTYTAWGIGFIAMIVMAYKVTKHLINKLLSLV